MAEARDVDKIIKVGAAIGDKWQPLRDSPLTEDMGTKFQQRRLINSQAASRFPGAGHRGGTDGRSGVLGGRTKQLRDPAATGKPRAPTIVPGPLKGLTRLSVCGMNLTGTPYQTFLCVKRRSYITGRLRPAWEDVKVSVLRLLIRSDRTGRRKCAPHFCALHVAARNTARRADLSV